MKLTQTENPLLSNHTLFSDYDNAVYLHPALRFVFEEDMFFSIRIEDQIETVELSSLSCLLRFMQ